MNRLVKWRIFYSLGLLGLVLGLVTAAATNSWLWLLAAIVYSKAMVILGVYVGYHRYFTHAAFKTSQAKHKLLCVLGFLSGTGSAVDWFIAHTHHHVHSDSKLDILNPNTSFWQGMTWNLRGHEFFESKQVNTFPKKLYKDKTIRFIHNNYFLLWGIMGLVTAVIDWRIFLFFVLLPIGFNNLMTTFISNITHMKLPGSYRNFELDDASQNNKYISWFLLAEGLHNNHHKYPAQYRQNLTAQESDLAGFIIEKFFIVESKK